MQTFETTNAKVARRCRFDQHRSQKTTVTVDGSLVTGLVRSVREVKSNNASTRWIITVVGKSCTVENHNNSPKHPSIKD
jgi:hypothetical protein